MHQIDDIHPSIHPSSIADSSLSRVSPQSIRGDSQVEAHYNVSGIQVSFDHASSASGC